MVNVLLNDLLLILETRRCVVALQRCDHVGVFLILLRDFFNDKKQAKFVLYDKYVILKARNTFQRGMSPYAPHTCLVYYCFYCQHRAGTG